MDENVISTRISEYLRHLLDVILFDEFSQNYLSQAELTDVMSEIPTPFQVRDLVQYKEEGSLPVDAIIMNMGRVIGADSEFIYNENYKQFIRHFLGEKSVAFFAAKAAGISDTDNLELACAYQRAAISLYAEPDAEILYAYADICTRLYNLSEDPDYTGSFKAEAIDVYETLTFIFPDFAPAWYQLGYAYANLGLYAKAVLTWQSFLELTGENYGVGDSRLRGNDTGVQRSDTGVQRYDTGLQHSDTGEQDDATFVIPAKAGISPFEAERKEIEKRITQMDAPMRIEKGCNEILAGRYQSGIDILEEFRKGEHEAWWPLWYYLGEAYMAVGQIADSEAAFKKVLTLSPSQIPAMEGLVEIYEYQGNEKLREKYSNKIKLISEE